MLLAAGRKAGPAAPGWRSLLGVNWHALSHAMRTGMAIATVPLVWRQLELPNLSQMAISVGAVMAVPVLSGVPDQDVAAIRQRLLHRSAGCALGGGFAAVLLLASPITQSFLPWLAVADGRRLDHDAGADRPARHERGGRAGGGGD